MAYFRKEQTVPFYLVQRGLFPPRQAAKLLNANEEEASKAQALIEPARAPKNARLVQQYVEARHYLSDQLLRDTDVFGMAHSIEVHVPFLDHELAEKVCRTPVAWRFVNG